MLVTFVNNLTECECGLP